MVCYCEAQTSMATKPYFASTDEFYILDPDAAPDSITNYCSEYVKQMVAKQGVING